MNSTSVVAKMRMRQWAAIIHECKNSGMSTTQWLKEHGIDHHSYYYWHKKLQDVCVDELQTNGNQFPSQPAFVEVPMPQTSASGVVLTDPTCMNASAVIHANGIDIELRNSASSEFLRRILEVAAHVK